MKRLNPALASLCTGLFMFVPASALEFTSGEQHVIGHWVVTAVDDGTGNFANCTAFGVYGEEQLILSHGPGGQWEFGLWRDGWSLQPAATYFLWYNFDAPVEGAGTVKRPVEAVEADRIFFEISPLEDLIERAREGAQLNLGLRGLSSEPQNFSYSLAQAGEALAAAEDCTRQNLLARSGAGTSGEQQAGHGEALLPIGSKQFAAWQIPGWHVAAYAEDATDAFTHCSILAEYENGTVLAVGLTSDGSWLLALHRNDWTLVPGSWSPVHYSFHGQPGQVALKVDGVGQAVDGTTIAVNMGRETWLAEWIADAPQLLVAVQDMELQFDVSDIAPGVEALQACAQQQQLRQEAVAFMAALLTEAGFSADDLLAANATPEPLQDYDAAFQVGEIVGGITVQPHHPDVTVAALQDALLSADRDSCGSAETGELAMGEDHGHFFAKCSAQNITVFYSIVPRPQGGYHILTTMGFEDGAAAESVSQRLYQAALR